MKKKSIRQIRKEYDNVQGYLLNYDNTGELTYFKILERGDTVQYKGVYVNGKWCNYGKFGKVTWTENEGMTVYVNWYDKDCGLSVMVDRNELHPITKNLTEEELNS